MIFHITTAHQIFAQTRRKSQHDLRADAGIEAEVDAVMRGEDHEGASEAVDVDDDADALAIATTRMTMNALLLYYATYHFQWRGDDPAAANLVAGVQEWVSLKAGMGLLEWGRPFRKPRPGMEVGERGAMAYFIDWLPAVTSGEGGGRMRMAAGVAINQKLRTGFTGERFWVDLFGMPFGVLWEGWQIHLRSLDRGRDEMG